MCGNHASFFASTMKIDLDMVHEDPELHRPQLIVGETRVTLLK